MWFDKLVSVLLFGSLVYIHPVRMDGDELFTLTAFLVTAVVALVLPPKRHAAPWGFGALLLYAAITALFNYNSITRANVANLTLAFVAYYGMATRLSGNLKSLSKTLHLFVLLSCAMIALQCLRLDRWYYPLYGQEVAGFSFRPWLLACTAALSTPYVLTYRLRSGIYLIPLFLAGGSTVGVVVGILGALPAVVASCPRRWAKKIAALSLGYLPLIGGLYFIGDYLCSASRLPVDRFVVWKNSLAYFGSLFWGRGLGTWAHAGFVHPNGANMEHWRWAHNEYFQQLYEQGIFGLGLAFGWLLTLCLTTRQPAVRGSLLALAALCLVHPVLHWGKLTYLVVTILALASIHNQNQPQGESYV